MQITTEFHTIDSINVPYVIAEIGLNHNGDIELARKLIEAAAKSGASAAKFQLYFSDSFISPDATLGSEKPGSLGDFFRQFELSEKLWQELASYTRKHKMDFLCSVFDKQSLKLYASLNPRAIKISSCDINNRLLIEEAALTGLPLLISTGTATEDEIENLTQWLPSQNKFALLQCVSSYPADIEDYNLSVISGWKKKFKCLVGVSDHTTSSTLAIASVAAGASIIERHFTLDKTLPGPDHALSANPEEFTQMRCEIDKTHKILHKKEKAPAPSESAARLHGRRSLCAGRDMTSGESLRKEDMIALRPGTGISPDRYPEWIGKHAKKPIKKGEKISAENFEN